MTDLEMEKIFKAARRAARSPSWYMRGPGKGETIAMQTVHNGPCTRSLSLVKTDKTHTLVWGPEYFGGEHLRIQLDPSEVERIVELLK